MEQTELERFLSWEKRVGALQYALRVINMDEIFGAPSSGARMRSESEAVLAGELFTLENEPAMQSIMQELLAQEPEPALRRRLELHRRQAERFARVPKQAYLAFRTALAESRGAWLQAKRDNDWPGYAPYLERLTARYLDLYPDDGSGVSAYDRMLDEHASGWNTGRYDAFFSAVRARLVPLLQRVAAAPQIDDAFLRRPYEEPRQRSYMRSIVRYLGFTPDWGKYGESEHPVTSGIFTGDVRFTTKYHDRSAADAVLSTVHECGHAWYFHNVDPAFDGTILAYAMEAAMQESQSRLCENHLGRSRAFWAANYPELQRTFPEQLSGISLDRFVRGLNVSRPTPIRTEADELTYPLHIMIRYELEKELFSGRLPVRALRDRWMEEYSRTLGVVPEDDAHGVLQDMHWPYAYFGYFPTYALGSAFAAQFFCAMRRALNVDALLAEGRYPEIMAWLGRNVHRYGALLTPDEVMLRATGEPFSAAYYLDYLANKYTTLYGLSGGGKEGAQ